MEDERHGTGRSPLRLLFLCTGNSARSQIGEALLARKGRDRFVVASAGSQPAPRVNPLTVDILREYGIDWNGRMPKGIDAVMSQQWDLIITVCDQAREVCPTLPGRPAFAHWGMPDPAAAGGSVDARRQAFRDTVHYLSRHIDLLLALPVEKLERLALEQRVRAIADQSVIPDPQHETGT
jgi:arsenate reductase (thioredoxin)